MPKSIPPANDRRWHATAHGIAAFAGLLLFCAIPTAIVAGRFQSKTPAQPEDVGRKSSSQNPSLAPQQDKDLLDSAIAYEERLMTLVNRMSLISSDLVNYPDQLPRLIGDARRSRLDAYLLLKEVKEVGQPNFDRAGGDFAGADGGIGRPLILAAIETEAATASLFAALRPDGSHNEPLMQRFKQHLDAAKTAVHDLLSGIYDHARQQNLRDQRK